MILTDYYKLVRLPENSAKRTPRYDCIASTKSYWVFEDMADRSKVKRFFCYYNGIPDTFSDRARHNAERAITNGKNISSVFIPSLERAHLGFGDVKGTRDALLFVFSKDYNQLEIFVARGYKYSQANCYAAMVSGGLTNEIQMLRASAKTVLQLKTDKQ